MITAILAFTVLGLLNLGPAYFIAFLLLAVVRPLLAKKLSTMNYLLFPEWWLLLAFGILYVLFQKISLHTILYYVCLPLFAYITGWVIQEYAYDEEQTKNCLIAIVVGFGVHALLNVMVNIGHNRSQLIDFWTSEFRVATGSGTLNTFAAAIFFYILFLEHNFKRKILSLLAFVSCFIYMFMLGTRTQFYIFILVNISCIFLYVCQKDTNIGFMRAFAVIAIILVIFIVLYHIDFLNLRTVIERSNMFYRFIEKFGIKKSNRARMGFFLEGLRALVTHPFGGAGGQNYYHNMWLDINRVSGIFPFVVMGGYSICAFRNVIRLFQSEAVDRGLRWLMMSFYIAAYLNFFVEPILEGCFEIFLAFMIINGINDCIIHGYSGFSLKYC